MGLFQQPADIPMRIATKITTGFTALIVLMAAILAYQLVMIDRLSAITRDLSQLNWQASLTALELLRIRDLVEEDTQKYFLLRDPDYRRKLMELREEFAANLREMRALSRSREEQQQMEALEQSWQSYWEAFARQEQTAPRGAEAELPAELVNGLQRLRTQSDGLFHTTQQTMKSAAAASNRTSQWADLVSWGAAGLALVISFLVSLFVVRSIAEPLKRLTAGTKAIAAGRFSFRLDTSGQDEFSQLAGDFNRMSAQLDELDQLKKDFVSHISHELKTPLASMRESLNLLQSGIPGPLTDKQRRFLQLGARSGERLSEMLGNLLDLSRMEAGMMDYELKSRDLAALVRTVIEEFEPQAREKGIQLKTQVPNAPLEAECDGERVRQVLGNLLINALKFTPQEGEIVVRLGWEPRVPGDAPESCRRELSEAGGQAGFAVLCVSDTGPGIPAADRERVFEKFHQLKKGARIAGQGAGLGLAISRTIIRAHRGALWVEERPGGGALFCVVLPVGSGRGEVLRRVAQPV